MGAMTLAPSSASKLYRQLFGCSDVDNAQSQSTGLAGAELSSPPVAVAPCFNASNPRAISSWRNCKPRDCRCSCCCKRYPRVDSFERGAVLVAVPAVVAAAAAVAPPRNAATKGGSPSGERANVRSVLAPSGRAPLQGGTVSVDLPTRRASTVTVASPRQRTSSTRTSSVERANEREWGDSLRRLDGERRGGGDGDGRAITRFEGLSV